MCDYMSDCSLLHQHRRRLAGGGENEGERVAHHIDGFPTEKVQEILFFFKARIQLGPHRHRASLSASPPSAP